MNDKKYMLIEIGSFLLVTIFFYIWIFYKFNPIYGINDDWTLYMVLSGSYLGYAEAHVTYILYPLAWLIGKLYTITNAIPWYGLILQGGFVVAAGCIFHKVFSIPKKLLWKLLVAVSVLILYWLSLLKIILEIQYTHTATIFGATALFLFVISKEQTFELKKFLISNIWTFFFVFLSLNLRENTAYMCIPMTGMLFIAKLYLERDSITKEYIRNIGCFLGVVAAIFVVSLGIDTLAYSSEEWKEYRSMNEGRAALDDYYGLPSYEEMQDFTDEIGMSEEEYWVGTHIWNYYYGSVPQSDFFQTMASRVKEKYYAANPWQTRMKEALSITIKVFADVELFPLNNVVLAVFLLVICLMVIEKNKKQLLLISAFLIGHFFSWIFIIMQGRFPLRIPQCLFFIDLFALLGILCYILKPESAFRTYIGRGIYLLFCIILLLFCFKGIELAKERSEYIYILQDRWYGMKEYAKNHLENIYIMDGGSHTFFYFSDDILERDSIGTYQNIMTNTNFDNTSPNFYKKLHLDRSKDIGEQIIDREDILWIYDKGYAEKGTPTIQYYQKKYPTFNIRLVDSFSTDTGEFEVYQMSR